MNLEPGLLHVHGMDPSSAILAAAIVVSLVTLIAAVASVRRGLSTAAGWLAPRSWR